MIKCPLTYELNAERRKTKSSKAAILNGYTAATVTNYDFSEQAEFAIICHHHFLIRPKKHLETPEAIYN